MDAEHITELVDGFIDQLREEFVQLSQELAVNVQKATQEVEMLGFSQEEAPDLLLNLADPMGSVEARREQCRMHANNIFGICEGMDPEEETLAHAMILERLRDLYEEIISLFSSQNA